MGGGLADALFYGVKCKLVLLGFSWYLSRLGVGLEMSPGVFGYLEGPSGGSVGLLGAPPGIS